MSDNLREKQVDMLLAYKGTPRHRLFEYPHRDDDSRQYIKDAEQLLDAILAERPGRSVTEWGVQYMSDLVVQVRDEESAHLRKAVSIVPDTVIVCRHAATPWRVTP